MVLEGLLHLAPSASNGCVGGPLHAPFKTAIPLLLALSSNQFGRGVSEEAVVSSELPSALCNIKQGSLCCHFPWLVIQHSIKHVGVLSSKVSLTSMSPYAEWVAWGRPSLQDKLKVICQQSSKGWDWSLHTLADTKPSDATGATTVKSVS